MSQSSGPSEKVTAILAQFPGPVTLRPSKLKWISLVLAIALLGVGSMVATAWLYPQVGLAIGVIASALVGLTCCAVAPVGMSAILAERMWARLDFEGFETQDLWGRRKRRHWRDTDRFAVRWVNHWPYTLYDDVNPASDWWDALNRWYVGGRSMLPDTYGLGAKNLAHLMTAWRQRALAHGVDSN
jgi:hypothetical protein